MDALTAMPSRRLLVAVALALVVATGCSDSGDTIEGYLDDRYGRGDRIGRTLNWQTRQPVGAVAAGIASRLAPAARATDGTSEYLRYDDDIVIVTATAAGSTVRLEDLDERYRSGGFIFLGPGFNPGSPAGRGGGGPGDVK